MSTNQLESVDQRVLSVKYKVRRDDAIEFACSDRFFPLPYCKGIQRRFDLPDIIIDLLIAEGGKGYYSSREFLVGRDRLDIVSEVILFCTLLDYKNGFFDTKWEDFRWEFNTPQHPFEIFLTEKLYHDLDNLNLGSDNITRGIGS